MKKIFLTIFLGINTTIGVLLLLSYTASYISPTFAWPIALLGMAYPYLLTSFLSLTILLLLFKRYKILFVNILIIFLGFNDLASWIQLNSSKKKVNCESFRLMSYNVKLFDLYNWKNNKKHQKEMLRLIKKQNPDIISFQEFYHDEIDFFADSVAKALAMPYYKIIDSRFSRNVSHFGQAIYSKFPIVNTEIIKFPQTTNRSFFCDISLPSDKVIRVFCNHLESYRFQKEDYQLMEKLPKKRKMLLKSAGILKRLKKALVKRSYQAEKVSSYINASPYPVIVTGDFNDTPNSYAYHLISKNLQDAFETSGNGFSHTYKGAFPSFRIDFILYSKDLNALTYKRLKFGYSDHYPICSKFCLNKK